MRGGELAVECWDCQQMANMRGERNGECDYIRNVCFVSYRASAAAAAGAERSAKRTSLPWGLTP